VPTQDGPAIALIGVSRRFGAHLALDRLDLTVERGSFLTLLGPSGSGKTTTLRIIGGFERPDSGEVLLNGQRVNSLPPERRDTATVFQSGALFPHLTVLDNVAYGLQMRGRPRGAAEVAARAMLEMVRLGALASRYPAELSGGQKQRVALARALVVEPAVVLFDEPLSALDIALRADLRSEIRALHHRLGFTAVFVTHDPAEAMALSDQVAVMLDGRLIQTDTPERIFAAPLNARVHALLGESCCLHVVQGATERLSLDPTVTPANGAFNLCLRPAALQLLQLEEMAPNQVAGIFRGVEYLGGGWRALVDTPFGQLTCLLSAPPTAAAGEAVHIGWASTAMALFPAVAAP
jgi:ABC-type Fe3+/spermidine/putrescine transport system ATPase subunit